MLVFLQHKENYISNIETPINLDILIGTFSAYDNFDGNISDNIKIEYEDYIANINKPGTYTVIISVTDNSKNKTSATFYIVVIDKIPPSIFYVIT